MHGDAIGREGPTNLWSSWVCSGHGFPCR